MFELTLLPDRTIAVQDADGAPLLWIRRPGNWRWMIVPASLSILIVATATGSCRTRA